MSNNKRFFENLLREKKEQDWFDFKSALKLYQSDGKLVEIQRDELLKDILGLANGNSSIIRKTKYLIIGADDKQFDENRVRVLHDVDYKIPNQNELIVWLKNAASPTVVGIESELIPFGEVKLWVITIPPTFDIHETTRELNAKGHFQKHVVFMRRDEHTEPASAREAATILQLKQIHRQEVTNPSSIWVGMITGAIVSLVVGLLKISISQSSMAVPLWFVQSFFIVLGIFFGFVIGFVSREIKATYFDWKFIERWRKIAIVGITIIAIIIGALLIK